MIAIPSLHPLRYVMVRKQISAGPHVHIWGMWAFRMTMLPHTTEGLQTWQLSSACPIVQAAVMHDWHACRRGSSSSALASHAQQPPHACQHRRSSASWGSNQPSLKTAESGPASRNHGCNQPQCVLCKHNPNRRCGVNFAGKYWVGDALLAKCEAEIDVEVIDFATQTRVEAADLPSFGLEVGFLEACRACFWRCSFLGAASRDCCATT